jgi:hypothetical protein
MYTITHIRTSNGTTSRWIEYKAVVTPSELEDLRKRLQNEFNAIIDFRYESK